MSECQSVFEYISVYKYQYFTWKHIIIYDCIDQVITVQCGHTFVFYQQGIHFWTFSQEMSIFRSPFLAFLLDGFQKRYHYSNGRDLQMNLEPCFVIILQLLISFEPDYDLLFSDINLCFENDILPCFLQQRSVLCLCTCNIL